MAIFALQPGYFWMLKFFYKTSLIANFIYVILEKEMGRKKILIFPKTQDMLKRLGENIRFARLRRNISAILQAERAGISRPTLNSIEKGSPSVSLGH
jgi:DNA-binding XRE family transcriptional regulator